MHANGQFIQKIEAKIDELIKDIEGPDSGGRGSVSQSPKRLKLPKSGVELGYPKPKDWILIDVYNFSIIHRSVASSLVIRGGTYMVLPNSASGISKEALKEAIEVVSTARRDEYQDDGLPGYSAVKR